MLNDDAVAGPGWIEAAGAALADPTVAAVTPKVVLDGLFGEILLDDDPWFAPGDVRPLGRQLTSVTVGATDVLEDGAAAPGSTTPSAPSSTASRHGGDGRRDADPSTSLSPIPTPTGDVTVNGEPVSVRATCRLLNHAGSFLEDHGVAGEYGLGAPDDGRFDLPAERFGFSGTAPVFRAETLRRLGGFAPQFFAYNEDTDWCLRARLAGLRVLYDPGATVRHRLSATSQGPRSPLVRFLAQRNALLCLVRNAPPDVARHFLNERLRQDPAPELRRAVLPSCRGHCASRAAYAAAADDHTPRRVGPLGRRRLVVGRQPGRSRPRHHHAD